MAERGPDATLDNCKASCLKDDACVAFSIIEGDWCIGCSAELDVDDDINDKDAIGYKKTGKQTKINIASSWWWSSSSYSISE